jgi:hypothetical protein
VIGALSAIAVLELGFGAPMRDEMHSRKGSGIFDAPSKLVAEGEGMAVEASGYCPACGTKRTFRLALGEDRVPPGELGNDTASVLIDAGQWLAIADDRSVRVPASFAALEPERRAQAQVDLREAFTAQGKRIALADPGRLSKLRIEAVLEAWTGLAAQYTAG